MSPSYRFNSRTHAGCDFSFRQLSMLQNVSIHAPTRGATTHADADGLTIVVSIHAPTRGATEGGFTGGNRYRFQFTHPRGVRHPLSSLYISIGMFQFTHPRGVRLVLVPCPVSLRTFQFTHPRGVRPIRGKMLFAV